MTTNRERIENSEVGFDGLQINVSRMEEGMNEKLFQLETALNKIYELLTLI